MAQTMSSWATNRLFFVRFHRIWDLSGLFLLSTLSSHGWCIYSERLQAMNDDGMAKLTFQREYIAKLRFIVCKLHTETACKMIQNKIHSYTHTNTWYEQTFCKCNHPKPETTIEHEDIDIYVFMCVYVCYMSINLTV